MNYLLILLVVVVVVFMFSGGKVEKVPAKLKSSVRSLTSGNKMVIGVLVGLALCWFLGNSLVEGFDLGISVDPLSPPEWVEQCCNGQTWDPTLNESCSLSEIMVGDTSMVGFPDAAQALGNQQCSAYNLTEQAEENQDTMEELGEIIEFCQNSGCASGHPVCPSSDSCNNVEITLNLERKASQANQSLREWILSDASQSNDWRHICDSKRDGWGTMQSLKDFCLKADENNSTMILDNCRDNCCENGDAETCAFSIGEAAERYIQENSEQCGQIGVEGDWADVHAPFWDEDNFTSVDLQQLRGNHFNPVGDSGIAKDGQPAICSGGL
jgi:hypothetical protein